MVMGAVTAFFLATHIGELLPTVGRVAGLGPAILPAGLALVMLGVLNRGVQARASYHLMELPAPLGAMIELSATSYATNKVVKSGGAAGLMPFLTHAERVGHNRARVVAAYLSTKVAETISLCSLIAIAVVASMASGALRGPALLGAIASVGYAFVVGGAVVVLATRPATLDAVAARARRITSRARTALRRPAAAKPPGASAGNELADAIARLRSDPLPAVPVFATAIVGKLVGFTGLCIVLAGLGIHLALPTALLIYTLALMASLAGPLPGGIGVADASLGALLIANQVPAPAAAAAVVAFRLLDLWLPLLAGAVTGFRLVRRARVAVSATGQLELAGDTALPGPARAPTLVPACV